MAERLFQLDPQKVMEIEGAYSGKSVRNRVSGFEKYQTGKVVPFDGYPPEKLRSLYNYVLLLDDSSQASFIERVVRPVQDLAEHHNIRGIYAGGSDLEPHITLQTGNFTGISPKDQQDREAYLASAHSHLATIGASMIGRDVYLNSIVLAGANFYVDSQGFMQENASLYRARQLLKWKFTGQRGLEAVNYTAQQSEQHAGLNPVNYDDITHVSVGRITEPASSGALTAFATEVYAKVEPSLQRHPLKVTIAGMYQGSAYKFFEDRKPNLIKGN